MVRGDPVFAVSFRTSRYSWTVGIWQVVTASIDLLALSRFAGAGFLLLREIGRDPDIVEEVAYANCAGEEEEVEEDPICISWGMVGWRRRVRTSAGRRSSRRVRQLLWCHCRLGE